MDYRLYVVTGSTTILAVIVAPVNGSSIAKRTDPEVFLWVSNDRFYSKVSAENAWNDMVLKAPNVLQLMVDNFHELKHDKLSVLGLG